MKNITHGLLKLETILTSGLMVGVVLFVFVAAVMRWVGAPLSWSVEFAQLLFVWVIFLGANKALREGKHIGVDFITSRLPEKFSNLIAIIMNLLMISFLVFVGYHGTLLSIENSVRLINNLPFSYSFVTMAVPIGAALMIITLLINTSKLIKKQFA
ncbi:TRAP transporter small permease [Robertmurraya massiliosenegalensis]|uniref:TRAP transporter small permease n=1 Tax=Robertmurraya TaxID=2837507 RepID=UPI0039A54268